MFCNFDNELFFLYHTTILGKLNCMLQHKKPIRNTVLNNFFPIRFEMLFIAPNRLEHKGYTQYIFDIAKYVEKTCYPPPHTHTHTSLIHP